MSLVWILIIILVVIVLWVIALYNRFVRLNRRTDEAWSDIEVQMKRRYDLIPNLINTVKGYAAHEEGVLTKVTEARNKAMGAQSVEEHGKAENMLSGALKSIFALSENYPDLKANTNFLELQRELSDTENKIQASRRFYNGNVRDLNIAVETFPSNIIARTFNVKTREFFDIPDDGVESRPVEVKF